MSDELDVIKAELSEWRDLAQDRLNHIRFLEGRVKALEAHKPLIPANAQSFVICNGKVRVWCVLEDVQSCSNCDFKAICNAIPTAILGCNNKHYRIVAVEMVEGE
jgi:hypothetical protein